MEPLIQNISQAITDGIRTKTQYTDLSIVRLVCWRSTGLQHLLHQVEADPCFALVLGNGEVVEQVKVSHVGAVRVPVLVHQPLPFAGVRMACADVLGLQMLQLAVDVISVRHLWIGRGIKSERGGIESVRWVNGVSFYTP